MSDNPNYSVTPRAVKGGYADVTKPFYSKEPFVVDGDGGGLIGEIPDGTISTKKFADDAKAPFAGEADIANSVKWANVQEKPATYEPSAHTHPIEQVEGLQEKINEKLTASKAQAMDDSSAEDLEELVVDFNTLLSRLRASGVLGW